MRFLDIVRVIVILLALVPAIAADGAGPFSVELDLSASDLCGSYGMMSTVTATNISSGANETLFDVNATLTTGPIGLRVLSEQTISLGDIDAAEQIAMIPRWTLLCDETTPQGMYTLSVTLATSSGSFLAENLGSITVHQINPSDPLLILNASPEGKISIPAATLEVRTDRDAICKYDVVESMYDSMETPFAFTGGTYHKQLLTSLPQDMYWFRVACKDDSGSEASAQIIFEIDLPPMARIRLNPPWPIKAGLVEIFLEVSEDLRTMPSLRYSLEDTTDITVPLQPFDDNEWKGYMIIPDINANTMGFFYFSAEDLSGNNGVIIENGSFFLVYTKAPEAPSELLAIPRESDAIDLSWTHSGEHIDHYNIYRSVGSSDTSRLHATVTQPLFIDTPVKSGRTYSYRVSATDTVGNEGPLSETVSVVAGSGLSGISGTLQELADSPEQESDDGDEAYASDIDSENLAEKIADTLESIQELQKKMTGIKLDLTDAFPAEADILDLGTLIREKRTELVGLRNDLFDLEAKTLDKNSEKKLDLVIKSLSSIEGQVPERIEILEEETIGSAPITKEDVMEILDHLLDEKDDADAYASKIAAYQDAVQVAGTIQKARLIYMDGRIEEILIIKKELSSAEGNNLPTATLFEHIPKSVVGHADDIIYRIDFEIVKADPLLKLQLKESEKAAIAYIIKSDASVKDAQDIKTIIVPDDSKLPKSGWSAITGAVVGLSDLGSGDGYNIVLILGVIIIAALALYYVNPPQSKSDARERSEDRIDSPQNNRMTLLEKTCAVPSSLLKRIYAKVGTLTSRVAQKTDATSAVSAVSILRERQQSDLCANLALKSDQSRTNGGVPGQVPERPQGSKRLLDDAQLLRLLELADGYVNAMDYDLAANWYTHIMANHQTSLDTDVHDRIRRLYQKLHLLGKVRELAVCKKENRLEQIPSLLEDIRIKHTALRTHATRQERAFLQEVRWHHSIYSQMRKKKA